MGTFGLTLHYVDRNDLIFNSFVLIPMSRVLQGERLVINDRLVSGRPMTGQGAGDLHFL